MKRIALLFLAALAAVPLIARAEDAKPPASYESLLTPLLQSGRTAIGEPIAYPAGTPKVTAAIVTLPPGKETGWHIHAVPLFAEILEGELTLELDFDTYVLGPGDSLQFESMRPHLFTNRGRTTAKGIWFVLGRRGPAAGAESPDAEDAVALRH